jgi:hypothetical protein
MKVLVREEKTGQYLGHDGTWVTQPNDGLGFASLHAAAAKAREQENCDVVLRYEEPPYELVLNPAYCA